MNHPERRPRLTYLTVGAAALSAAVLLAPFPVASAMPGGGYRDIGALRDAVGSGFVRFWSAGQDDLGGDLARAADFWTRFHVVKAALSAVLLLVLAVLVARVCREFAHAVTGRRRLAMALTGVVTAPLAVLALLVLVANVQGAIAPLSSVLGVLPLAAPRGQLAGAVHQVRHSLAAPVQTPAREVLVHDFTVYHVAMAVLGGVVTLGLLAAAVVLWRHRARVPAGVPGLDRRWRRVLALGAVALVGLGGIFGLLTAANVSTAAHPGPALLGFFEGGL